MSDIAPLDYERYAVLVSPLQIPETYSPPSVKPGREVETLSQVSADMRRPATSARNDRGAFTEQRDTARRGPSEREGDHPLNGPFPTDLGYPPALLESPASPVFGADFDRVARLYEQGERPPAPTTVVAG